MKPNADLTFIREPEVDPTHLAAVGRTRGTSHKNSLPPERLWCLIFNQDGDLHQEFVSDEDVLKMKIGLMKAMGQFSSAADTGEGKRAFFSAWQLVDGCWHQLEVELTLKASLIDKYVPDDDDE